MTLKRIFLLSCFIKLSFITSAHAYIDPNTGGFFFQTVAPFVFGILGGIVVFWKRITGFFKGLFIRNKDQNISSDSD